ncbi:MAG: hypothetical protein LBP86_03385 [Azoarcus sp.]|jgi:hypothetical protein|nr:hypothetical protein [Azoarcus sp.]
MERQGEQGVERGVPPHAHHCEAHGDAAIQFVPSGAQRRWSLLSRTLNNIPRHGIPPRRSFYRAVRYGPSHLHLLGVTMTTGQIARYETGHIKSS